MPNPKINKLLVVIRDTRKPKGDREFALKQLEQEINGYSTKQEALFHASLSNFEQQWGKFEEGQRAFESGLDSILSGDVNEDEVDRLVQQAQDEVNLERRHGSSSSTQRSDPEIVDLEKRLQALKEFSKTLPSKPHEEEDEFAKLERQVEEEGVEFSPRRIVESVDDIIGMTEEALDDLEEELESVDHTVISPTVSDNPAPTKNSTETKPKVASVETPTVKQGKSTILDAFVKNFKSFIQSVGDFFNQAFSKKISLQEATTELKMAQTELASSGKRLNDAKGRIIVATSEIPKMMEALSGEMKAHRQAGKTLQLRNALLLKLGEDNALDSSEKASKIKLVKSAIEQANEEYQRYGGKVTAMTHQLEQATEKLNTAHQSWKDAKQMHGVVVKSVESAIIRMDKALEQAHQNSENSVKKQQDARSLLEEMRSKYGASKEQEASVDQLLDTRKGL